ncbi:hypothetical protein F53441_1351 [Fusarium austroafricanum]|uniref:Uncharacterized protein n=1 Tax=Fusarium austroafricanum TaxID=2364996 RepID=A0A8H4KVP2_9HYPO|nr:hypothetical protein F53441_1351 [Fusarium austroafricanum]
MEPTPDNSAPVIPTATLPFTGTPPPSPPDGKLYTPPPQVSDAGRAVNLKELIETNLKVIYPDRVSVVGVFR